MKEQIERTIAKIESWINSTQKIIDSGACQDGYKRNLESYIVSYQELITQLKRDLRIWK